MPPNLQVQNSAHQTLVHLEKYADGKKEVPVREVMGRFTLSCIAKITCSIDPQPFESDGYNWFRRTVFFQYIHISIITEPTEMQRRVTEFFSSEFLLFITINFPNLANFLGVRFVNQVSFGCNICLEDVLVRVLRNFEGTFSTWPGASCRSGSLAAPRTSTTTSWES